jgi:hypothetical protein
MLRTNNHPLINHSPCPQPSHHIPYLYSMADAASKSQSRIRQIAQENYNATSRGLSGVRLFHWTDILTWLGLTFSLARLRMKIAAR